MVRANARCDWQMARWADQREQCSVCILRAMGEV